MMSQRQHSNPNSPRDFPRARVVLPGHMVAAFTVALLLGLAFMAAPWQDGADGEMSGSGIVLPAVHAQPDSVGGTTHPTPADADSLERLFERYNYRIRGFTGHSGLPGKGKKRPNSDGVIPRLFLEGLPPDLADLADIPKRKSLFLRALLPLVLAENEALLEQRQGVQKLQEHLTQGMILSEPERVWLGEMLKRYKVSPPDLDILLGRVDAIPVSLALAQAAVESGWGTSRFAVEGNAMYGQWTWSSKAQGIVPENRPKGSRHRIRSFTNLAGAVRAYMHALNSSWAYRAFRVTRHKRRTRGLPPNGPALAPGLRMYSQERDAYTNRLRQLIAANGLHRLDSLRLRSEQDEPYTLVAFLAPFFSSESSR